MEALTARGSLTTGGSFASLTILAAAAATTKVSPSLPASRGTFTMTAADMIPPLPGRFVSISMAGVVFTVIGISPRLSWPTVTVSSDGGTFAVAAAAKRRATSGSARCPSWGLDVWLRILVTKLLRSRSEGILLVKI